MTRLALAFSVAAIAASGWSAKLQGQNPTPTFRGGVRTVAVYATVQERNSRLVPDLTRDDFEVRDNGRPVKLTVFSNQALPITVALMLDMSSFGTEVALSPLLTGDKRLLARVLAEELWPGSPWCPSRRDGWSSP